MAEIFRNETIPLRERGLVGIDGATPTFRSGSLMELFEKELEKRVKSGNVPKDEVLAAYTKQINELDGWKDISFHYMIILER